MSVNEPPDDRQAVLARLAALEAHVTGLEAHVAGLEEENARQRPETAGLEPGRSAPEHRALVVAGGTAKTERSAVTGPGDENDEALSRRRLLKRLGGAAAAGAGLAAGASVLGANPAAANHANSSPPADLAGYLHVGLNGVGSTQTEVKGSNAGFVFRGENTGSGYGVWAISDLGVGLRAFGADAPLMLVPIGIVGPPTSGSHLRGEIFVDTNGAIFQCVSLGTPGTWVRIGLNPLSPARIADTRPGQGPPTNPLNVYDTGPFNPQETRTITVAGPIGPSSSQQTLAPIQASAAVFNLTVTGTTAQGHVVVWPAGVTKPLASSINWSPGSTIANGVTVKLGAIATANQGKINVYNSAGNTHVILDLVGFYS